MRRILPVILELGSDLFFCYTEAIITNEKRFTESKEMMT
jgi:hypothetical protein